MSKRVKVHRAHKVCRILTGVLSCILLLTGLSGCGAEKGAGNSEQQPAGEASDSKNQPEKKKIDLTGGAWKAYSETVEDNEVWHVSDYWGSSTLGGAGGPTSGMRQAEHFSAADGNVLYLWEGYIVEGEKMPGKYLLTVVDMSSFEARQMEVDLQEAGEHYTGDPSVLIESARVLEDGGLRIMDMDVYDGRTSLLLAGWEDGKTSRALALTLDQNGKVQELADLLAGLEQSEIMGEGRMPRQLARDSGGNYYVTSDQPGTGICVLSVDGTFKEVLSSFCGESAMSSCTFRLPDRQPVFACFEQESQTIAYFIYEDGKEKLLYGGAGGALEGSPLYVSPDGEILWLTSGGIMRWDAASGKCERFYRNNGIYGWDCEALWEEQDGSIVLACYDGEETSLYKLSKGEGATEELMVYVLFGSAQTMERAAARYSRMHPETSISVEEAAGEDRAVLLNKLMVQMIQGEGPDVLVLNGAGLEALQDQGALADLSVVLPEDVKGQMFEGALQYGTIGDRLYGISYQVSLGTLLVRRQAWDGKSWTLQDLLSILKKAEDAGQPYERIISSPYPLDAGSLLYLLTVAYMDGRAGSLIDEEAGKCNFDMPEFVALLEACKKYGEEAGSWKGYKSEEEMLAELAEGKALVYQIQGDLADFSRAMAAAGEGYNCVGYPVPAGNGHLSFSNSFIALNAGTQHYEAADFINYLYSENAQQRSGSSTVRKDVMAACVVEVPGEGPAFLMPDNTYQFLEGKPDGSSFVQEYIELLDAGAPTNLQADELAGIMLEEAGAFFNGDKSAQEAAKLIQNRLQLYLDAR